MQSDKTDQKISILHSTDFTMKKRLLTSISAAAAALALAPSSWATLATYDAAIAADNTGGLPYAGILSSAETFDGSNIAPFDFGSITGAATFEFIIEGDPVAGGRNGYIGRADGNAGNSLRYEQWDDTGTLGFTRSGVADYNSGVPSPTAPTHVTYLWDGVSTMQLFIDGVPSATVGGATFEMPNGVGHLGNVSDGGPEGMIGTIHRVTTYDSALTNAQIAAHANAWLAIPEPSGFALLGLTGLALILRRRR